MLKRSKGEGLFLSISIDVRHGMACCYKYFLLNYIWEVEMRNLVPLLLLALLFIAGCVPGVSIGDKLAVINSFDARPAGISAGES